MFEGNMLRVATGTPMRRMERANNSFAEAEPEPFTLANLTTKSFVALIGLDMAARLRGIEEKFLHVPGAGRAAFRAQSAMQEFLFDTAKAGRSEEHTSELQSPDHLLCPPLL